jgi:5-methylcytosine-specific restriction endonuclease McrA
MPPVIHQIADYMAGRPAKPRSPHWARVRGVWLQTHGWCAVCGFTAGLNVHHIQPFHLFPELELDPTNFITLGERCPSGNHHILFGHFGNYSKWNPDVRALAAFMFTNYHQPLANFNPTRLAA